MIQFFIKSTGVFLFYIFVNSHAVTAENILIKGGKVLTAGPAGILENVDILVQDHLIAAIGKNLKKPEDARVINAIGKIIAPGFMHPHSLLGLSEVPWTKDSNEQNAMGSPFNAAFNVKYGFNSSSQVIADNRRHGLTRSAIFPGHSGAIFRGTGALVTLDGQSAPHAGPMVAKLLDGGNRNVAWAKMRAILGQVKLYQAGQPTDYLLSRSNIKALIPVVNGKQLLALQLENANDIKQAIALKQDYNLNMVLVGATEAWMVAHELAQAKIPVIINPDNNTPKGFSTMRATNSNAALLAKAEVLFAIAPSIGSHGSHHIAHYVSQYAAIAVAHGLSYEEALKAISINPARIFGISDQYGSIEVGKEADIVVWDGDPLEVTSHPDHVIVRGQEHPLVSRRTLLRDKYHPATKR